MTIISEKMMQKVCKWKDINLLRRKISWLSRKTSKVKPPWFWQNSLLNWCSIKCTGACSSTSKVSQNSDYYFNSTFGYYNGMYRPLLSQNKMPKMLPLDLLNSKLVQVDYCKASTRYVSRTLGGDFLITCVYGEKLALNDGALFWDTQVHPTFSESQ